MAQGSIPTPQQEVMEMALHQTWYVIVQPTPVIVGGGQPGQKMLGAVPTLKEAQEIARKNPPALVVLNCVVDTADVAAIRGLSFGGGSRVT